MLEFEQTQSLLSMVSCWHAHKGSLLAVTNQPTHELKCQCPYRNQCLREQSLITSVSHRIMCYEDGFKLASDWLGKTNGRECCSWKWAADLMATIKHALGFATGPMLKWEDLEEPANDVRRPQIMWLVKRGRLGKPERWSLRKIGVMLQSHGRQSTKVGLFSSFPFFWGGGIYDKPWIKRLSVKNWEICGLKHIF